MFKSMAALLVLGALLLAPLAGCWTTKDGIQHTALGKYTVTVNATPDHAIAAAREVAREMNLTEVVFTATKLDGHLLATTATDETVEINTTPRGERQSDLSVRVGTNGDKELSKQLIDKIKARL